MAHPFLTDEWIAEAKALSDGAGAGLMPATVTLNIAVTGGPRGDHELHLADGGFSTGFIEAPTKLILPYDLARKMFVDGDQQAAMQGFMAGKIKVEGDMSKLMAMQAGGHGGDAAAAADLQAKLKEITADD